MSEERGSESQLSELVGKFRFQPFSAGDSERITQVFALLRPSNFKNNWYAATSGDQIESLALMWSTFCSLQVEREGMDGYILISTGEPPGRLVFAATKLNAAQPNFTTFGLNPLEELGIARLCRSHLMDIVSGDSIATEEVPISDIVDLPMLLGPTEAGDMPLDLQYALLVFAIEDDDGGYRWAYRTSGEVNRLELIGALDLEIHKLRRTLTEFE